MKNKSSLIICFVVILSISGMYGCKKNTKADTPTNAAVLLKQAIDENDYEAFNKLFNEGRKELITKGQLTELKESATPGSTFKHYEVITYDNGEMILVRLTPDKVKGEYKVEDIVKVPQEMKKLFQSN